MADVNWNVPLPTEEEKTDIRARFPGVFGGAKPIEGATTPSDKVAQPEPSPDQIPPADYKNMNLAEAAFRGVGALPGSVGKVFSNLGYAATHLPEVGGSLVNLGEGAVSKVAGALGVKQNPAEKARAEATINAIAADYAKRYGSMEGFTEALATDPASILMDLGTVLPGVGVGAKAAGLTKVAKALDAAKYLDPLTGTVAAANVAATPVLGVTKKALGLSTGMGSKPLDWIQDVARQGNPEDIKVLREFASPDADPYKFAQAAKQAISEQKAINNEEFVSRIGALRTEQLPKDQVLDALQGVRDRIGAQVDENGKIVTGFPDELNAVNEAERIINSKKSFSAEDWHKIKVEIRNMFRKSGAYNGPLRGAMEEIPDAIKGTINAVDSNYDAAMDMWQEHLDQMNSLADALKTGGRKGAAVQLARVLKDMKNGKNHSIIEDLSNTPSGKKLKPMLAGAAMQELFPDWFRQANPLLQTLGAAGLGTGAVLGMVPHVAGSIAVSSPKLMGSTIYGAGALQRGAETAADILRRGPGLAAYNLGELAQDPTIATTPRPPEGSYFKGGRIGRKSGGRVGNAGSAAEKLIAAAEKAKKGHSDTTSPLLDVPDEAITKALAIANEKI